MQMANRKLYNEKSFAVKEIIKYENIWHLIGVFTRGSICSIHDRKTYRIRVEPDQRWKELEAKESFVIVFIEERFYECQGEYGSHEGRLFAGPQYDTKGKTFHGRDLFTYKDFQIKDKIG